MTMESDQAELLAAPRASTDWPKTLRVGFAVIAITFVGLGGWTAFAHIDSAVVAEGTVAVETSRKTLQHFEGGIVAEILARDGDLVHEGDVLLRLDRTRSEATARTYRQELAIALAMEARLFAQRDMADAVQFPTEVLARKDDPLVAVAMRDNDGQFQNRRESLLRLIDVLEKQIAQAEREVEQAVVDQKTAQDQLDSIDIELPNLRVLLSRGLVAVPRVTTLERQQMQTKGQFETAKINIIKGRDKIAELRARIDQARQDYRQEGANAIPEVRKTIGDARQQLVIASDALQRVEIKAPVTGTVQQLRIFTIGGVIKPGDPILDLVPQSDTLVVRAKVMPVDIDRIGPGMKVDIRVPQFLKFEIKPIEGVVRSVSRDSMVDQTPGASNPQLPYFAIEVAVDRAGIDEELRDRLTAGMMVETIIRTQERTVLSYLTAPLRNRLAKSMRER
jgi:S-layer protein transport system membrane fusion protein